VAWESGRAVVGDVEIGDFDVLMGLRVDEGVRLWYAFSGAWHYVRGRWRGRRKRSLEFGVDISVPSTHLASSDINGGG